MTLLASRAARACLLTAGLIGAATASATTYEWSFSHEDLHNPNCAPAGFGMCSADSLAGSFGYNTAAGLVESLYLNFDDVAKTLDLVATFSPNAGGLANAIEVVITDGPKPDADGTGVHEHTMLYLDGFADPGTVSAYTYNESPWPVPNNSYEGALNARYDDAFTLVNNPNGSITFSMIDLDMSALPGNTGFGPELGIWFHTLELDSLSYGNDGGIDSLHAARVGWVDGINPIETTVVPIPGALWLFGSALLGMVRVRRS